MLRLLVTGRGTAEIGEAMGIQVATVRRHLHNLYDKIGVGTRGQAILWALGQKRP